MIVKEIKRPSYFDKEKFIRPGLPVITAINMGSKQGGHAILVIERLDGEDTNNTENNLSITTVDILAIPHNDNNNNNDGFFGSINSKGIIYPIRINKTKNYQYFDKNSVLEKTKISHYTDDKKIKNFLKSVKKDQKTIEKWMNSDPNTRGPYPLKYQMLGSESTLTDPEDGDSCSSYLAKKLRDNNIIDLNGKKPEKFAGGCLVM